MNEEISPQQDIKADRHWPSSFLAEIFNNKTDNEIKNIKYYIDFWAYLLNSLDEYLSALKTTERITENDYSKCDNLIDMIMWDLGYSRED